MVQGQSDLFASFDLCDEASVRSITSPSLPGEKPATVPATTTPRPRQAKPKLASSTRVIKRRAAKPSENMPDLFSQPEREAAAKPSTIGQMIKMVDGELSLSPTRRRDWKSGLTTLLRVTDASENLPATGATLRDLVRQMEEAPGGLDRRRRENLRSSIKRAARHCGVLPNRPTPSDLNSAWYAVKEATPESWLWRRCSQLAYWASVNGIDPIEVTQAVFDRFGEHLLSATLEQDPDRKLQVIAKAWNQLRHSMAVGASGSAAVSLCKVSVASTRNRVSGDWASLPPLFVADIDAYCRSAESGGLLFDDNAPDKPLRSATIGAHREGFRRAGFVLLNAGFPAERLVGVRTLVEPNTFELWVGAYHDRLGRDSPALFNLIATLVAWAKRTGAADAEQIKVMRRPMTRLGHRRKEGMTPKNKTRIRQFTGALTQADWLSYGERLVRDAKGMSPKKAALQYQTALVHEIMLVAPLRLTNLVELRIGLNLVWQKAARWDRLFLIIPSEKVKNSVDLQFELPARVADLYRRYLDNYRPVLIAEGDASDWMWPGQKVGTQKTSMGLSEQVQGRVKSDLGLSVNMHLYRHLAAWFYLQARPGDYETMRRLLGHKSIQTTINYYIEIDQMMISRNFNAVLDELRTKPVPRR